MGEIGPSQSISIFVNGLFSRASISRFGHLFSPDYNGGNHLTIVSFNFSTKRHLKHNYRAREDNGIIFPSVTELTTFVVIADLR